jgi:hypothetical protein
MLILKKNGPMDGEGIKLWLEKVGYKHPGDLKNQLY